MTAIFEKYGVNHQTDKKDDKSALPMTIMPYETQEAAREAQEEPKREWIATTALSIIRY